MQGTMTHTVCLLVHDRDDEPPVAAGRQELKGNEVVDEPIPVPVGQMYGGTDHGLPVSLRDLGHQPKV